MIEKNNCIWLRISSTIYCNRFCYGIYCSSHSSVIRRFGRAVPVPCRLCGSGTKSATQLCVGFGAKIVAQKLIRVEQRAKKNFPCVLKQLVEHVNRQEATCSSESLRDERCIEA